MSTGGTGVSSAAAGGPKHAFQHMHLRRGQDTVQEVCGRNVIHWAKEKLGD